MNPAVTIRAAREADTERIGEVMFDEPPAESTAIIGDERAARELGKVMVRLPGSEMGWQHTVVAELDGRIVGILQPTVGGHGGVQMGPRLAFHAIRIIGPFGIFRLLPRLRARERLNMKRPDNAYHISELHVDQALRGQGIGGALLDYAEQQARAGGHVKMSLETTTSNPARRLYERHGFRIVDQRTDPKYKEMTGVDGRIQMIKDL